jgi:uncharacterized membrane protein YoaK (UPF0700 family)
MKQTDEVAAATSRAADSSRPPHLYGIYLITCICGIVDAASFLGLGHTFVELMTGNLVFLSFELGLRLHGQNVAITSYVVALTTFSMGATAGGRFGRVWSPYRDRQVGFLVEWVCLLAAVLTTLELHPRTQGWERIVVIGVLAFGMGIQNAMLRRWGVPNLATNVMTLTMTALIADSPLAGGDSAHGGRRALSIALFALSAFVGAFLVPYGVVWPLLVALGLMTVAIPILLRRQPSDTIAAAA